MELDDSTKYLALAAAFVNMADSILHYEAVSSKQDYSTCINFVREDYQLDDATILLMAEFIISLSCKKKKSKTSIRKRPNGT